MPSPEILVLFLFESVSSSIKSVLYDLLQAELALDVLKSLLGLNSTSEERLPCWNRLAIKTRRPRNVKCNQKGMMNLEIHIQSVWRSNFMRSLQSWAQLRRWSNIVQRRKSMRPFVWRSKKSVADMDTFHTEHAYIHAIHIYRYI